MLALLLFPVCALLWVMLNAWFDLVEDQPPGCDAAVPPRADRPDRLSGEAAAPAPVGALAPGSAQL